MWLNLLGLAAKTGAKIYENRQKTKEALSQAELRRAELAAKGEIELQNTVATNQKSDWKDEFIILLLSAPIVLLAWAVFSEDPQIMAKMQLFFQYFSDLPFWYQTIFVGVIASVYGLKATDLIKRK